MLNRLNKKAAVAALVILLIWLGTRAYAKYIHNAGQSETLTFHITKAELEDE